MYFILKRISINNKKFHNFRSGKVIQESDKYEIISNGPIHMLIIKKSTTNDESEYICTAVNVKTSTKLKVEGTLLKI